MISRDIHYYCQDCQTSFDNPVELQDYDDSLVDKWTPKEDREMLVCPSCGSDEFEEVTRCCEDCARWLPKEMLKKVEDCADAYICVDCLAAMKQKREDEDETNN